MKFLRLVGLETPGNIPGDPLDMPVVYVPVDKIAYIGPCEIPARRSQGAKIQILFADGEYSFFSTPMDGIESQLVAMDAVAPVIKV